MRRRTFRIQIGLIALAHLVAASELGALLGFLGIWAMIIAVAPLGLFVPLLPEALQNAFGAWGPPAVAAAIGLAFAFVTMSRLFAANAARRAGDHDAARSRAISGLFFASVPACFLLSLKALADAWP